MTRHLFCLLKSDTIHAVMRGVSDKALALAPPAAGAAKPMRARNGTDAAAKPAEAAPTVTGCPEAVDALGLCAANLKQGKQ